MRAIGITLRGLIGLGVLAWCGAADATTLLRVGLDELVAGNRIVVVGEVVDAHSYWNDEGTFILTDVTIKQLETIKGAERSELTVTLMGGTVGETTTLIVAGATLVPGRSYVLFLGPQDLPGAKQALTVRDHAQGAYDIVVGKQGELRAVSQAIGHPLLPDGQGLVDAPGGAKGFPLDAMIGTLHQSAAKGVSK